MWRKSDAKPSSSTPNAPSSIPPKTQAPSETTEPKQATLERPTAFTAAPAPTAAPAVPVTPEKVSPDASRIGAGLKIRGEISGNSDLILEGQASGKIRVSGARVTVGQQGKVQADIDAREIIVNGEVQGSLKAEARVRLGASSRVEGSLAAPSVGIDDGARFRGKVEVTRAGKSAVAAHPEPANDALLKPVAAHVENE